MALNPDEIRAQAFPQVKKGGVDPEAVQTFLASVAEDMGSVRHDLDAAVNAVDEARREVDNARTEAERARQEAAGAKAEIDAQRAAVGNAPAPQTFAVVGSRVDEVLDAAQRSADAMVRDAEGWSANHRREADEYATSVRSEVDDLRRTTEEQATTYREETLAYATAVRDQADADAAATRNAGDRDAQDQYDRLMADATERVDNLKQVERNLLDRLTVTAADLEQAREEFRSLVDNHADVVIAPTPTAPAPVAEPIAEPVLGEPGEAFVDRAATEELGTGVTEAIADPFDATDTAAATDLGWSVDEPATVWTAETAPAPDADTGVDTTPDGADEPANAWTAETAAADVDVDVGTTPDAVDERELGDAIPAAWTPTTDTTDTTDTTEKVRDTAGDTPASAPAWVAPISDDITDPIAGTADADSDPWAATTPDAWTADAEVSWDPPSSSSLDEVPTAWVGPDVDADTDPWGSGSDIGADVAWTAPSTGDDAPAGATAAWQTAGTSDPWGATPAGDAPAWTPETTGDQDWSMATTPDQPGEPAPVAAAGGAGGDDDPLAAMVRRAVERVTEGDGKN